MGDTKKKTVPQAEKERLRKEQQAQAAKDAKAQSEARGAVLRAAAQQSNEAQPTALSKKEQRKLDKERKRQGRLEAKSSSKFASLNRTRHKVHKESCQRQS